MTIIKSSHIVQPATSTPNEIMYISELDQIKPLTHAPTIYFYRLTRELSTKDPIQILKNSLCKALVTFYPLAGRLNSIGGGGRVELHCNSMGAVLIEAESNLKIYDFGDFRPTPEISTLIPSINSVANNIQEVPLLMIQLTKFACGGLSLGLKMSHIVADGQSAIHFVAQWAKIARGERSIDPPPILDRRVLRPTEFSSVPKFVHPQLDPPPFVIGHSDNLEERTKPTDIMILHLRKEQAQILKNKANEYKTSGPHGFSRFEALAGHIWKCVSKARMHKSEQETSCYIIVDCRNRINPPLPQGYFGNTVFLVPATTTVDKLLSRPMCYAAGKIREAVKLVTNEYIISYLMSIKNLSDVSIYRHSYILGNMQGAFYGNPNLIITSWTGLPLHDVDFGWGKEIYMGPASLGYDGRVLLIPNNKGDDSLSIPLRLQVEHIDDFHKYFYDELN